MGLLHRLVPNMLGEWWSVLVQSHSSCLSLWIAKQVAPSARLCRACGPQAGPLDLLLKPGTKPVCDSLNTSISRHELRFHPHFPQDQSRCLQWSWNARAQCWLLWLWFNFTESSTAPQTLGPSLWKQICTTLIKNVFSLDSLKKFLVCFWSLFFFYNLSQNYHPKKKRKKTPKP